MRADDWLKYGYGTAHHCRDGRGHACPLEATVLMHAPDGLPVPGGWMCDAHAQEVVEEYRAKLGEEWRAVPVP